ncbi:MAG: hypothetical protein ACJARZ_002847 [Dokdonia sp.]
MLETHAERIEKIVERTEQQNWSNADRFDELANDIVD